MIDRTGKRYGKWTAVRCLGYQNGELKWLCRCDCGRERAISVANLSGNTTCCVECRRKATHEAAVQRRRNRRAAMPPEYPIWQRIKRFAIRRWQTFEVFIGDVGSCPPGGCLRRRGKGQKYGRRNTYWQVPLDRMPAALKKRLRDRRTRNKAVAEAVAYNVSRTDLRRLLGVTRERVRQIIQRQKAIARLL